MEGRFFGLLWGGGKEDEAGGEVAIVKRFALQRGERGMRTVTISDLSPGQIPTGSESGLTGVVRCRANVNVS